MKFVVTLKSKVLFWHRKVVIEADEYATGQTMPMLYFYNRPNQKDVDGWKSVDNSRKNVKEVQGAEEAAEIIATFTAGEWLYVKKVIHAQPAP